MHTSSTTARHRIAQTTAVLGMASMATALGASLATAAESSAAEGSVAPHGLCMVHPAATAADFAALQPAGHCA